MPVLDLNVGGCMYATSLSTLTKHPGSLLADMFGDFTELVKDAQGRLFIDRDGKLFSHILNYLRTDLLVLPAQFKEIHALLHEAEYYKLDKLVDQLKGKMAGEKCCHDKMQEDKQKGYVSLCVRGTYAFGRDGQADVKFRKLQRIMVSGNVVLLREAFGDQLNETRDADRGGDTTRYTTRFFLKHNQLEKAFDQLGQAGFALITSSAGGAGYDTVSDETKWNHFANYVFCR